MGYSCRHALISITVAKYHLLLLNCVPELLMMTTTNQSTSTAAPFCYLCGDQRDPVYHHHNSGREIRVVQGVDKTETLLYMCTTCKTVHPDKPDNGMNVLVGTSQLHGLHNPRDPSKAPMDPDPFHIDWLTVCGATIPELEYAWRRDYESYKHPMRILLTAGLDDLARGRTRDEIVESFLHFKMMVDRQNSRHPGQKNELVIATILNPPRFVWFKDNGPPPKNHKDMLQDIMELNSWIIFFNNQNGKPVTPRFHRFGIRDTMVKGKGEEAHHGSVGCLRACCPEDAPVHAVQVQDGVVCHQTLQRGVREARKAWLNIFFGSLPVLQFGSLPI